MIYTGYLDFWFKEFPLLERVDRFADIGVHHLDIWCWRSVDMKGLAGACKAAGSRINSTFDEAMGSLADPADNKQTLRSWEKALNGGRI